MIQTLVNRPKKGAIDKGKRPLQKRTSLSAINETRPKGSSTARGTRRRLQHSERLEDVNKDLHRDGDQRHTTAPFTTDAVYAFRHSDDEDEDGNAEDERTESEPEPATSRVPSSMKTRRLSRSTSMDADLVAPSDMEQVSPAAASSDAAEIRKASWPESRKVSASGAQDSLNRQQSGQLYHASLPGSGDVKARLEWELQQSLWFLQFSKPCPVKEQGQTQAGFSATPAVPIPHPMPAFQEGGPAMIDSSGVLCLAAAPAPPARPEIPVLGNVFGPTPVNSPHHSLSSCAADQESADGVDALSKTKTSTTSKKA